MCHGGKNALGKINPKLVYFLLLLIFQINEFNVVQYTI